MVAVPLSLCSKAGWAEMAREAEPWDVPTERSCCQRRAQSGDEHTGLCLVLAHESL